MMYLRRIAIILGVGIAAPALVGAANGSPAADSPLTMQLKQKHKSGITGTATITTAGTGVRVVLRLKGRWKRVHPAHIHFGPCRNEPTFANPRISSGLLNVARGRSATFIPRKTLAELQSKSYSINVHDPRTLGVVACGDIPRAS